MNLKQILTAITLTFAIAGCIVTEVIVTTAPTIAGPDDGGSGTGGGGGAQNP
jgi:hypothetical protein